MLARDAMVIADADTGLIVDLNDQAAKLLGQDREALKGKHHTCLHPPEMAQTYSQMFQEHVSEGEIIEPREVWLAQKDGTIIPVEVASRVITYPERTLILGIFRDLRGRKKIEKEIQELTEHLWVTLKSIGDGVISTDCEGLITLMNPVAEHLTGWTFSQAQGLPLTQVMKLINAKTRSPIETPVERVLQEGTISGLADHTILVSKEGTELFIADNASPIRDDHGRIKGVVIVFRDISAMRRLEEELARLQKLDSLGILAGGIAHDFNNLLTAILGNIFLARVKQGQREALNKLEEAEKAVLRAKDLTQQLLTFATGGSPVCKATSIHELITEAASFALVGAPVELRYYLEDTLWNAHADSGQIAQVLQNILINARQAMPTGGTITIRAQNVILGEKSSLPLKAGRYIKIEITDQGVGILPEHLSRIFDPYFSTKQEGRGLGLTVCFSVIRRHQGHMLAHSKVGQGSTFTIYLPATTEQAEDPQKILLAPGHGHILVMDDEEAVRKVMVQMLRLLGYKVTSVSKGEEALEVYQKHLKKGKPFAAVILDLTIPHGLGGTKTLARLLEIDPTVKAIVTSGYSNDPVLANYKEYGFVGLVAKPFKIEELGRVLSKVLKSPF